ncbi:MAG: YbaK/EbsC family protein [Clostridia bacterium]|nr:YbaK/EbsC family protein [Clostridia bacterium]
MSVAKVEKYLNEIGAEEKIIILSDSSATVELAAQALGTQEARIAKTLSFLQKEGAALIVTAGDAKVDNKKHKEKFGEKAKMIPFDEVEGYIGHAPGGVCPFGVNEGVNVYLDKSLSRFETVFPAAGDGHSAIELTLEKLAEYAKCGEWVDVCKGWE